MESKRESEFGICYECNTKNADSSQKPVFHCDLCEKWFCEEHLEPKFPYFVDWDTVLDVCGDPKIKLLFHTEHARKGGHPDFIYFRRTIEGLELEERVRDELIRQAIDRMEAAFRKRKFEAWERKAEEEAKITARATGKKKANLKAYTRAAGMTITTENKFGNMFPVPLTVYSNPLYREYLNDARTRESVKVIVDEYFQKYPKEKRRAKEETTEEQQEPEKKKHWWQRLAR